MKGDTIISFYSLYLPVLGEECHEEYSKIKNKTNQLEETRK